MKEERRCWDDIYSTVETGLLRNISLSLKTNNEPTNKRDRKTSTSFSSFLFLLLSLLNDSSTLLVETSDLLFSSSFFSSSKTDSEETEGRKNEEEARLLHLLKIQTRERKGLDKYIENSTDREIDRQTYAYTYIDTLIPFSTKLNRTRQTSLSLLFFFYLKDFVSLPLSRIISITDIDMMG